MKLKENYPRLILITLLVLTIATVFGCSPKGKQLPLYPPDLTPEAMLRIMNRRAMLFGGGDADVSIDFYSGKKKVTMQGAFGFDSLDSYRLQLNAPNEPPVADIILQNRVAKLYFPNALKKIESPLDALIQSPSGLICLTEALHYLTSDLSGFIPYGVQMSTKDFVFIRRIGTIECMAMVHRPTLTIRELVYSRGDDVLFTIQYGKFQPLGDGAWPSAFLVTVKDHAFELKFKSLRLSGRHALGFYVFEELPDTEIVGSIEAIEKALWRN